MKLFLFIWVIVFAFCWQSRRLNEKNDVVTVVNIAAAAAVVLEQFWMYYYYYSVVIDWLYFFCLNVHLQFF